MSTIETLAEPSKPEKKKRVRGGAMENLVKASADQVRDHCQQIAEALVKRVIAGDVNSARLLLALIDKLPKPERKHQSIALRWLKSGPWQGPPSTEDNEDNEDKETNELLGEEFTTALENYRRAEQEIAARNTASIHMSKKPL